MIVVLLVLVISACAHGMVFINEVFMNPPGSGNEGDIKNEFIELAGTPGMKLDGYAVAVLNGTQTKYYPLGSIPTTMPAPGPEIDMFLSLDGLSLGDNGILALIVGNTAFDIFRDLDMGYVDATYAKWSLLWSGSGVETGTIDNNGSLTFMIVRNRPGITDADRSNPAGTIWAKEVNHDQILTTPVDDDGVNVDQWGDGHIDTGDAIDPVGGGMGNSLDMTGLWSGDLSNDLEVVDEVSFEDSGGHEYDTDDRHVDEFGGNEYYPHRHVHALDDPNGFNPDAITRVDYRTKGPGWPMTDGGVGEYDGGTKNWQDTATEQWIRGNTDGPDIFQTHYYDNSSDVKSGYLQPYNTNIPIWLDDGTYSFTPQSYQIMAGSVNPLAVPIIPGDIDRDGDCDFEDIAKMQPVFGNADWIFSNSFEGSPEGSEVDPSSQTKPWDLDGTGDNGIEASDMQWVLNFQGDTTGHVTGVQYTSQTPAADGVVLNSNVGTECTVSLAVNVPSGRDLDELVIGDIIEVTVRGRLSGGANTTAGEENGIMQYINDITISSADVAEVIAIDPLGTFSKTNESLESYQGVGGDLGVNNINGFTTSFTEGLSVPAALYMVTLEVVGVGTADIDVWAANDAAFAASTPEGLKIGHTDNNGDPASSIYMTNFSITTDLPLGDLDGDWDVDYEDFVYFCSAWLTGVGDTNWNANCDISEPSDNFVDVYDIMVFANFWLAGAGL